MTPRRYCLFPTPLERCVEKLTRPVFKAQGIGDPRIVTQWASIVGTGLARHTLPEKLSFPRGKKSGGTLVISVENGFATELQHMQPVILERLAGYFGYPAIARIVISHSWTLRPPPEKAAPGAAWPDAPRPPVIPIADGELKEALESLAAALSGKK